MSSSEIAGGRSRRGEFRHYAFTAQEVLEGITRFLQYVGYRLKPIPHIGSVQQDFSAVREGGTAYEIAGIVRGSIEEAVEGLAQLSQIRRAREDIRDFVLVLPPINDYLLMEFLTQDKGKRFFQMKDEQLMLWLHNPQDQTTWCFIGEPQDKRFQDYFVLTKTPGEYFVHLRLEPELLEEEY